MCAGKDHMSQPEPSAQAVAAGRRAETTVSGFHAGDPPTMLSGIGNRESKNVEDLLYMPEGTGPGGPYWVGNRESRNVEDRRKEKYDERDEPGLLMHNKSMIPMEERDEKKKNKP